MHDEPVWLPKQVVLDINKEYVALTGENYALLFPDRLDSALLRPQNRFFYEDVYDVLSLSVTLMFGIAEAHAFEQGNKRTGFAAGIAFLFDNGYSYAAPDTEDTADAFLRVINKEMSHASFEDHMAPYLAAMDDEPQFATSKTAGD